MKNLAECPITSITVTYDEAANTFQVTNSVAPDTLPLASFKFSLGTPCINESQQPKNMLGQLADEYNYSTAGCTQNDFFGTDVDSRFKQVGTFTVNQGDLERLNYISDIFTDRFHRNDVASYKAMFERGNNELGLYGRSVIGWKLECESDVNEGNHFSRQEAYEMIFKKKLNTQSDNLRGTMFYGPLFVSILAGIMLLMAILVACQSFLRTKDCLMMMVSCSTNNGSFACASTCITAFLFFYLLLFFEALSEANSDLDFVQKDLAKVNNCLGPLDQINVPLIESKIPAEQQHTYEMIVIMLFFYIIGYCLCLMPASICLFRMRK